jgi:hypothetical protein
MEKKFYLNVFLYNTLIAPAMQAFRKMAALGAIDPPDVSADNVHSDNRIFTGKSHTIASIFYKIFNPLTAAWLA